MPLQKLGIAVGNNSEVAKNDVPPVGQQLDHPTVPDQLKFTKMRLAGQMTAFRANRCGVCQQECPKPYRFCSAICFKKHKAKEER